jgi:hypothetical protein
LFIDKIENHFRPEKTKLPPLAVLQNVLQKAMRQFFCPVQPARFKTKTEERKNLFPISAFYFLLFRSPDL